MISCYIIGNSLTIESLSEHIEKFPLTKLIGYSLYVNDNLVSMLTELPKLVFVEASYIFKFKATLVSLGKLCNIVYLAETTSYAYEAFETFALDYLMKPLTFDLFERSINKFINFSLLAPPRSSGKMLIHKKPTITDSFFIRSDAKGMKDILIKCKEVVFIESEQNYVVVHTEDNKYVSHNTLKDMEENLAGQLFIRVHKSFIINCDKISFVEGNVIVLNEKLKIPIGLTYRKAFYDRMSQKVIKKKNFLNMIAFSEYATKVLLIFNFLSNVSEFI